MKRLAPYAGSILILQILSYLTSYFVTQNAVNSWYRGIQKSALTPPDWVFPVMWGILYTILAVALVRLWRVRTLPAGRRALIFFTVQLVLNYSWSFVFFGMAAFAPALAVLLLIVGFTVAAMKAAQPADRTVTLMLMPYLAWISFATYLTFVITRLN